MAVSASYMPDLSRVRVSFTGFSTLADYAKVERSVDGGITWVTIRGGDAVPVAAGAGHVDDYAFGNGLLNTYRVTAVDSQPQSWVGSGGPVSANNGASVTPFCNGSTLTGDLVLLLATVRLETATPVQPAGWTTLVDHGNVKIFARYATADGSTSQAVTFTGAGAGDDTTAQMTTFRNTDIALAGTAAKQINASQQNLPWPGASPDSAPSWVVGVGWKQALWTSAPTTGAWGFEAGQISATAGNDASHVWWVQSRTDLSQKPAGFWTITGGSAAVSRSTLFYVKPRAFTDQETTTITPVENRVVFKIPARPSLNFFPEIVNVGPISRKARSGTFDVMGRTNPIVVSDKQGSRQFELSIDVNEFSSIADADLRLSSGSPLYIQMPPGFHFVPTCYVSLGDISLAQDAKASESMTFVLPMTEVAEPANTVYGDTYIWADVISDYASWTDVLADVTSWSNLIDKVGTAEVIVP